MRLVTIYTFTILFWRACSSQTPETKTPQAENETLLDSINFQVNDSGSFSRDVITKVYSQSIAEFIKAASKKHNTRFDTLFFGKRMYGQPDDFPDIELPETIENTPIRLLAPELGLKKQKECKSLVYINMIGWLNNEKAEFIFVIFSNGSEHQYDCFINYKYNTEREEFEIENLRFEYFLYKNKQEGSRFQKKREVLHQG